MSSEFCRGSGCSECATAPWERSESLPTFFSRLTDTSDFPARWYCGTWSGPLGWLHIVADLLIFAAYFAIPTLIAFYMWRRRDNIPFPMVGGLFAAFILLCGTGHLMDALIFWWPAYRLSGLLKLATALVSVTTVAVLVKLLPAALELPGIARMNEQLLREAEQRTVAERTAALEKSNKLAILEGTSSIAIIATDADGLVTMYNHGAERLLGYGAEDVIGRRSVVDFHDAAELQAILSGQSAVPSESDDTTQALLRLAEQEHISTRDWTYITSTGERRTVRLTASRLRYEDNTTNGYLFVATDVTAQRAQEHELRKLAIVARKTINAVVIADRNRRVVWVNDSFTRMTGYTMDEVRGRTPGHFLQGPETNRKTVDAMRAALDAGEVFQGEIFNYAKSGEGYWQALTITPVHSPSGEPEGFISVQTDITETRRALDRAAEANRVKSQFLANMSHEIRTPLTAIIGFSELLQSEVTEPEQADMAETIHRNGEQLLDIINDILDLSKIEAGQLRITEEPTEPVQIVSDVVQVLSIRAQARDLSLTLDVAPDVPETVQTDGGRFRQIAMNLIGNAIKFTDVGGVTVRLQRHRLSRCEFRLVLHVIDTGIGIPSDLQHRLFQPFQQLDGSATRRHGGTGLGLSISRQLAEALGGSIQFESTPGKGSRFSFISRVFTVSESSVFEEDDGVAAAADSFLSSSTLKLNAAALQAVTPGL